MKCLWIICDVSKGDCIRNECKKRCDSEHAFESWTGYTKIVWTHGEDEWREADLEDIWVESERSKERWRKWSKVALSYWGLYLPERKSVIWYMGWHAVQVKPWKDLLGLSVDTGLWFQCIIRDRWKVDASKWGCSLYVFGTTSKLQEMTSYWTSVKWGRQKFEKLGTCNTKKAAFWFNSILIPKISFTFAKQSLGMLSWFLCLIIIIQFIHEDSIHKGADADIKWSFLSGNIYFSLQLFIWQARNHSHMIKDSFEGPDKHC